MRAAKVFLGDILTQAGLDQRRAGHAHGGLALDHDHEVGQGDIVGGPGKTLAQHGHGLGHPAGIAREPLEDRVGGGEMAAVLAVLDAVAAAFQQAQQGHAVVGGGGEGLVALGRAMAARAAAQNSVIVGHDGDRAAPNQTRTRNHPIGGGDRVLVEAGVAQGLHQGADLMKAAPIHQVGDAFAGGVFTVRMLAGHGLGPARVQNGGAGGVDAS